MTHNDPKWPKNDPKWPKNTQHGPKMTQNGPKNDILVFGGTYQGQKLKKKIAEKVRESGRHFWAIWGNFGPFWVIFGPFWIIPEPFCVIWGHIWVTLANFGSLLAILGANLQMNSSRNSVKKCLTRGPQQPLEIQ